MEKKIEKLLSSLHIKQGYEFIHQADLSLYSTFKIKAFGSLLIIQDQEALKEIIPLLVAQKIKYKVIGWGSNVLLEGNQNSLLIKLDFSFNLKKLKTPKAADEIYWLPASLSLGHLTQHAIKFGLKGWEVFTGIPASLGGAVAMNAGTSLGEIGELVSAVRFLTLQGELKELKLSEKDFSYRKNLFLKDGEIIVEVALIHRGFSEKIGPLIRDYFVRRCETQPLASKTFGCMFKNISPEVRVGKFLDLLGLKGFSYNGVRISPIHANFMENEGDASPQEAKILLELIQNEFYLQYGESLEFEVKLF